MNHLQDLIALMKGCPSDLNYDQVRMEYIENHIKWVLINYPDAIGKFLI